MRSMFKKWFLNIRMQNLFAIKQSCTKTIKKNKESRNMESIETKEERILHQVQSLRMMTILINIKMIVQRFFGMNNY